MMSLHIYFTYAVGGYHYLHVAKPGLDRPLIEQMGQADYVSNHSTTQHTAYIIVIIQ